MVVYATLSCKITGLLMLPPAKNETRESCLFTYRTHKTAFLNLFQCNIIHHDIVLIYLYLGIYQYPKILRCGHWLMRDGM